MKNIKLGQIDFTYYTTKESSNPSSIQNNGKLTRRVSANVESSPPEEKI
jgi:hypothetical protein